MSDKYTLDGRTPVPCNDLLEWGRWYETADRVVKQTDLGGGVRVSTVFLGLDHRFMGGGPPILFETMVFAGKSGDGDMDRYSTWEEAEAGHERMVERAKASN